ncbi:MAG: GGDEF domain-containing protein, partial [Gallionella sp.]
LLDYVMSYALNKGKQYAVEANQSSDLIISHGQVLILVLSSLIAATGFAVIGRVRFLHEELSRQATTDYLTGVPNRRHFIGIVDRDWHEAIATVLLLRWR